FFSSLLFLTSPPPTALYTLSLHDALPIFRPRHLRNAILVAQQMHHLGVKDLVGRHSRLVQDFPAVLGVRVVPEVGALVHEPLAQDRKSTRLNSSHRTISYAVFCLKKKK